MSEKCFCNLIDETTGEIYQVKDSVARNSISGLQTDIDNKVDKVDGKELSTNDYTNDEKSKVSTAYTNTHTHSNKTILDNTTASFTTADKTKLDGIENGAEVNDPLYNTTGQNTNGAMTQKSTSDALNLKADDDAVVHTAGDTISGDVLFSNTDSSQVNQPNLKWKTVNSKVPYVGYATDQVDGTFVVGSITGTNYASGLAIGGGSGNLLWKGGRVATAADIRTNASIVNLIYPVGSIYMSVNATSPATLFGGTWVAWGNGRVPIGIGSNGETNYTTAEQTGGSENSIASHNHTQNSHTHTQNAHNHTQNQHRHKFNRGTANNYSNSVINGYTWNARYVGWVEQAGGSGDNDYQYVSGNDKSTAYWETATNQASTATNNATTATNNAAGTSGGNRQPYITCYMWKRTA